VGDRAEQADDAPPSPGRGRGGTVGVTAVLVVAGLLFAASARAADGSDLRNDVTDLAGLVQVEAEGVDRTSQRVAELRQEIDGLTGGVADAQVQQLQGRADELALPAGLRPVQGPGVQVTLHDAPRDRPVPEGVDPDLLVVHQQDLQGVVNALWAGGAEAMTIMDQRIVATSAVRCVGSTLRLQGRVYSPPYTIRAIGDPEQLAEALDRARPVRVYQEYVRAYGLGYDQDVKASIRMPAFDGPLEMRHAQVPDEGSS
jgi:uncharacterized protein YlxW (UPF0749 family)